MEKLFLDLEAQWMTAWKNKDVVTVRKILSDDSVFAGEPNSLNTVSKPAGVISNNAFAVSLTRLK